MIDLAEYSLAYTHKESGKTYKARRLDSSTFNLYDDETKQKKQITAYKLRKEYVGAPENLSTERKRKNFHYKGLGIYGKSNSASN